MDTGYRAGATLTIRLAMMAIRALTMATRRASGKATRTSMPISQSEDNDKNPQWVLINFEKEVPVQALRILWGEPFATQYEVQYWEGEAAEFYKDMLRGRWRPFPKGLIEDSTGGGPLLRLSNAPVRTHYVRIVLKKSSGTAPAGSTDARDRLGFAIRELYAGVLNSSATLKDAIAHAADGKNKPRS